MGVVSRVFLLVVGTRALRVAVTAGVFRRAVTTRVFQVDCPGSGAAKIVAARVLLPATGL